MPGMIPSSLMRSTNLRLLEEGLVEKDDSGDALKLGLGHSEQQLPEESKTRKRREFYP